MSDDTVRVRVDRGDYRHQREHYTRGQELDVTPKVLEKHPNSLTRVDEPDSDGGEEDETDDSDDEIVVDPDPSELTVDELRDRVTDVDDVELLKAIKGVEKAGENRETAKQALDKRLAELEG